MQTAVSPEPRLAPPPIRVPRAHGWSAGHLLAAVVVVLMVATSLGGLLAAGFYTDGTWARSAFRGNDLATLAVAAPLLGTALAYSVRGSLRGRLVTLGMLGYGVYNYAFYVFGAAWNDWFLLHVAALVASLYGLLLLAAGLDRERLARAVTPGVPRRAVAAFTAFTGLVLAGLWTWLSLRYAVTGELDTGTTPADAMHLVFALDLTLMAPALVAAAVLLWRDTAAGFAAAVAANVLGGAYQVALASGAQFQADAGIAGKGWFSLPGLFVTIGSVAAAAVLLRHVRSGSRT
ncbi:MAG TPA: hypothetical protein VFQ85_01970 [Mycobacteriales bacterium]|jgi:hypothetical protein|nr:hypothetical protein [Mycobacteriales bacterium]